MRNNQNRIKRPFFPRSFILHGIPQHHTMGSTGSLGLPPPLPRSLLSTFYTGGSSWPRPYHLGRCEVQSVLAKLTGTGGLKIGQSSSDTPSAHCTGATSTCGTSCAATANHPVWSMWPFPNLHLPDTAGALGKQGETLSIVDLFSSYARPCTGRHLIHMAPSGGKVAIPMCGPPCFQEWGLPLPSWDLDGLRGCWINRISRRNAVRAVLQPQEVGHLYSCLLEESLLELEFPCRRPDHGEAAKLGEPHTSPVERLHGERHLPHSSNQPSPGARQVEEDAARGSSSAPPECSGVCGTLSKNHPQSPAAQSHGPSKHIALSHSRLG